MRALLVLLILAVAVALSIARLERTRPQDLPWTPLALDDPPGMFTRTKLARLGGDPAACRALLTQAGIAYRPVTDRVPVDGCGWVGAVRLGAPLIQGAEVTVACPVAVAAAMWERRVLRPLAEREGRTFDGVTHFGAYSCRRLYGRPSGPWSEHATANALDVSGFRLDGRAVSVLRGWDGADAAFVRGARDGACRYFGTTLSPDYNAAHRDHLHLDMKVWGPGYGVCR